jgi:hypothetical protein
VDHDVTVIGANDDVGEADHGQSPRDGCHLTNHISEILPCQPSTEVFGNLVRVLGADHKQVYRLQPASESFDGPRQHLFQDEVEEPISVAFLQQPHAFIRAFEDSCAKGWREITFHIYEFECTIGVRHKDRHAMAG